MKQKLLIYLALNVIVLSVFHLFDQLQFRPSLHENINQGVRILRIDHECHYPFNPGSIIAVFIFFEEGINYITLGEKRCAWHFVKKLQETVNDSYLLPEYFQKKFLENIREARKRFDI